MLLRHHLYYLILPKASRYRFYQAYPFPRRETGDWGYVCWEGNWGRASQMAALVVSLGASQVASLAASLVVALAAETVVAPVAEMEVALVVEMVAARVAEMEAVLVAAQVQQAVVPV
jgi:hypothetical protein